MDTSIKRLLEVAGVDITKGKAKELCEGQDKSTHGLLIYSHEGEQIWEILNLPATMTNDEWMSLWNKELGKYADYFADEDPDEGDLVGPGNIDKRIPGNKTRVDLRKVRKQTKDGYFGSLRKRAKENMGDE